MLRSGSRVGDALHGVARVSLFGEGGLVFFMDFDEVLGTKGVSVDEFFESGCAHFVSDGRPSAREHATSWGDGMLLGRAGDAEGLFWGEFQEGGGTFLSTISSDDGRGSEGEHCVCFSWRRASGCD